MELGISIGSSPQYRPELNRPNLIKYINQLNLSQSVKTELLNQLKNSPGDISKFFFKNLDSYIKKAQDKLN